MQTHFISCSPCFFTSPILKTHLFSLSPMCCPVLSTFSRIWLFATPWTIAHQYPLSMGFSRQEYWSGLPCSSPVKVKVAQLCSTLCNSMDSRVHGILQARILKWVVVPFSRGSFQPEDWTQVSHIAGRFFTVWATREAHWCVLFDNCHCWALWRTVIQLLDLFTAKKNVFNLF